ncbi:MULTISPECIES: DUF2690 domain-containing protein [Actinomycetes]|uniref:DUF2690 domain-containing protein n=1 Tax=Micromonospora echinofusca TaxID=47858 RepID=A0A1C5GHU7_MICEH|nr:DUF2690 domain-containing protein [Micromonospora echinofusca]SCG19338.1 Protein of unknown function [Micromonospora echinofusca]
MRKLLNALGAALALGLALGLTPTPANAAAPAMPSDTAGQLTMAEMITEDSTFIDAATLAAIGCGQVCDYKNPASYRIYYNSCTTCYYYCADDAITPSPLANYDKRTSSASIELRYSPRCRTAWARTTWGASYFYVESRYLSGSHRATAGFTKEDYGTNYTAMLNDADLQARACMPNHGPVTGTLCTSWY